MLRGWAILAVVCNHTAWWGFDAMFWWAPAASSPNYNPLRTPSYYALLTMHQLTQFSLPAFLFISGCFVAYAARGDPPALSWKVVKRRLLTLLWPYLTWSLVVIAGELLLARIRPSLVRVYAPGEYLMRFLTVGVEGGYWFIPLLLYLYVFSPFIVRLAVTRPAILVSFSVLFACRPFISRYLTILGVTSVALDVTRSLSGRLVLDWCLFLSLGVVIGLRFKRPGFSLARFKWWLLAAAAALGTLAILEADLQFHTTESRNFATSSQKLSSVLYQAAFIFAFLSWDTGRNRLSRIIGSLGGMSYGILLLHWRVLWVLTKALHSVAPRVLDYQVLLQPLLLVSAVGLPCLLMRLVLRSPWRRFYHYLFG